MTTKQKALIKLATDVTAGQSAYALAVEHSAQLTPRLPAGTITTLAADLTTLGSPPPAPAAAALASTATLAVSALAAPPTLAVALSNVASLVSAIHGAVRSGTKSGTLRKAYAADSRAAGTRSKEVLDAASTIVARATAQASEALALGVLPADVTALQQAILALNAAETAANGTTASGKTTVAEKRAATVRVDQAVEKIAAARALAFALVPATRALFEALRPKRK